MTEKELCFDDIKALCKQGYLDNSFWHTNGNNSYIGYFEKNHFIGAIEYHFEGKGIYLDMFEISKAYRRKGYGRKIVGQIKREFNYIKCVPKDCDVATFYEKLDFKVFDPPFYVWME